MKKTLFVSHARNFFLFLVTALCLFFGNSSKAQTVTIGTGTSAAFYSPWSIFYGYSYCQTIYLQSEINAVGNISSIKFNVNGPIGFSDQIKVYMKHVARGSFTSTTDWEPLAGMTLVYDGTLTGYTTPGWITINLTTPFAYNNTDNLLIAVDENKDSYDLNTNFIGSAGTNRVLRYASDGTNPDPASPPTGTRVSTFGNIQIDGLTLAGCQPATNIAISNLSSVSATASWTAPAGGTAVSQYEWELRTSGAAGSGATGLVNSGTSISTSVNLSGLVSNTAHNFYVRTACTGSTFSPWSGAVAFTTPCGFTSYGTIPYTQGFESWINGPCGGTTAAPGPEWIPTPTTGNSSWRRNDQGFTSASWSFVNDDPAPFNAPTFSEGSYSARFHTYGTAAPGSGTLLLGLNCSSASGPLQLSFDYRNPTGTDSLVISVSTNNGTTYTRLDNLGVSSAWNNKSFVFTSTSAQTVIKLQAYSDYGNDDIGMDNLIVQAAPSCLPPTGLGISNITAGGGATFSWNTVPGASNYEVVVSNSASVPTGAGTSTSGAATYNFSSLAPNTTYFAYVRSSCGSGFSSWTSVQFSTTLNDNCSGAILVTQQANGSCTTTTVSTVAATQSTVTAPSCSAGFGYEDDVWYKFVATGTGAIIKLSNLTAVSGTATDVGSAIYTGSSCGTLTEVTGSCSIGDGTSLTTDRTIATGLTIGQTYYVRLYGGGVSSNEVTFNMCISQLPTPPTSCPIGQVPANNATAITYPATTLSWNAVATATSYDVYFGTANPPTTSTNVTTTSYSVSGLVASTPYYWYVVPKNAGGAATGCNATVYSFTTDAAPPPAPANDDCSGAVEILGWGTVAGSSVSSTQSIAPVLCNTFTSTGAGDVWYKFTTQNAGTATIVVTGYDVVIEAFSGACGSLTSIKCADVSGTTETLELTGLTPATTYYFRVYGYGTVAGAQAAFTVKMFGPALPVSLTNFKGTKVGNNNVLSWTTATEINNAGFELQRSADGINFSALDFVASQSANGNSNSALTYTFTDTKSLATGLYYRLKQLDKDGKSTFSNVVFIKGVKSTKLELASVYPNPTVSQLNVLVASPKADNITFIVSDLAGKVIMSKQAAVVSGDNNIQLNVVSLAKGTYTIRAICADGCETAISKFVKQ